MLGLVVLVGACGGGNSLPAFPDAGTPDGGNGLTTLISSDWSMPSGEMYQCERKTVANELYVTELAPIAPDGTHHTVLAMGSPNKPDGTSSCDAFVSINSESYALFGSGVGTDPLVLPDGVAMRIPAGEQLLLNLHLFNASDGTLSGTSGVQVKTVDASAVQHVASTVLVGPVGFTVPSGTSMISGTCHVPVDVTTFAIMPHMHKLGTHMKVVAAGTTLLDQDYGFDSQKNVTIAPFQLHAGDTVDVTCTYVNGGAPVGFGESTNDEMCFAAMYHYPALPAITCSN